MNIKEFCETHTTQELKEYKIGMEKANQEILKRFVSPDNICTMVAALDENNVMSLGEEVLTLSVICMTNLFNLEVCEKELFRREMEDE